MGLYALYRNTHAMAFWAADGDCTKNVKCISDTRKSKLSLKSPTTTRFTPISTAYMRVINTATLF